MKKAAQLIVSNLTLNNSRKIVIEIIDCSAGDFSDGMMHDRFIQYTQGHHISSGGFRNVHHSILEVEDLGEVSLSPKTYFAKVNFDDRPTQNQTIIYKKTINPISQI